MDCMKDSQTPVLSEEVRNWLELPPEVLSLIFLKLGAIDILLRAQSVCSLWHKISKEPLLFRSIDMRNSWNLFNYGIYDADLIVREAVDRSCGQLVEFSMGDIGNDLLAYIADKSGELRCLRLVSGCQLSGDALINLAKKAVMLEKLEICHCSFSGGRLDMLKTVGNACHQLKSFRLNCRGYRLTQIECDDEALAIAESMPELRHLHLFGNKLTNVGLRAILDGCLHLESLDLRQCFNLSLEEDLVKICRDRLIKLSLPNDSTDDYEFGSEDFSESSDFSDFVENCNDYDLPYEPAYYD